MTGESRASGALLTREGDWYAHPLTRCTLLSLAPARAAASPDAELSSWLAPWAPPAGRGGGGGGVAPVGGGGTGGGGGGGGPLQERVVLAADEGCPGGRMGPEMQREESVSSTSWCPVYCFYFRFLEKNEEQFVHQRDEEQNSLHLRKALQNLALLQSLSISVSSASGAWLAWHTEV